jgi:hypothetical protein
MVFDAHLATWLPLHQNGDDIHCMPPRDFQTAQTSCNTRDNDAGGDQEGHHAEDCFHLMMINWNMQPKLINLENIQRHSGNVVFIWGCLFSLTLDSIVGIKMAQQKPEILDLWKRVLQSF